MENGAMDFTLSADKQWQGYDELMDECRRITKHKVSEILAVNMPLLDTPAGKLLLEEQMYSLLLQMLAYMNANMHISKKEKQRQGIEAARAKGVHMGRKTKFNAADYVDIYMRVEKGELNKDEARELIGASHTTYFKMKKQLKETGAI